MRETVKGWFVTEYRYDPDDFPELPEDLDDLEYLSDLTMNTPELETFLVTDDSWGGRVVQVVDVFTTADDRSVIMTVSKGGELELWSDNATFMQGL